MANTALLALLGLAAGSFLSVLSFRYDLEKGLRGANIVRGRSRCPACARTLRWFELLPLLSFLVQAGRCRSCGARISLAYPALELTSALVFIFVPRTLFSLYGVQFSQALGEPVPWFYLLSGLYIAALLVLLFVTAVDMRFKIIPDGANILLAMLGIGAIAVRWGYGLFAEAGRSFLSFYASLFGFSASLVASHLAGFAFGAIFFGAIVYVTRGRGMGMGDVKLAAALGLLFGWPDIVLITMLAFISGGAWGILMVVWRRAGRRTSIPFGPFIALGSYLTLFFGSTIMEAYFTFFP